MMKDTPGDGLLMNVHSLPGEKMKKTTSFPIIVHIVAVVSSSVEFVYIIYTGKTEAGNQISILRCDMGGRTHSSPVDRYRAESARIAV